MENLIFVHAHIFKNAGSSIDSSLQENFGDEFLLVRASPKQLWRNPEKFSEIVRENRPLKAVSAHWVNLRDMHKWGFDSFPFLMIRNPLERARSVYNFERKQKQKNSKSVTAARNMTFRQYVEWSMSDPIHSVLQNHQTRHCSGVLLGQLTDIDFSSALDLFDRIPVTGVVDFYDETMVLLEKNLSQHGIAVDLSYIRQNVTQESTLTIEEKIACVKEDLGSLFHDFEAANKYDLMLYERSRQRLLEQTSAFDDFGERLSKFRLRCVALSNKEHSESTPIAVTRLAAEPGILGKLWNRRFRKKY